MPNKQIWCSRWNSMWKVLNHAKAWCRSGKSFSQHHSRTTTTTTTNSSTSSRKNQTWDCFLLLLLRRTFHATLPLWKFFDKTALRKLQSHLAVNSEFFLHHNVWKKSPFMLAACILQMHKDDVVSAEELSQAIDDLEHVMVIHNSTPSSDRQHESQSIDAEEADHYFDEWSLIYEKPGITIWSRSVPGQTYCQYKVHGSFTDIPARAFYYVQVDLEFRKKWDDKVHKLSLIHVDKESGSEVIHWICNFPRPMYKREYVYSRRCSVDQQRNCMVIVNKAVNSTILPDNKSCVRVTDYCSKMVIKPHKTFDENGFDYILTYFDDTKTNMPTSAYNYMAAKGLPDFLNRLHTVAKGLVQGDYNCEFTIEEYEQATL